MMQKLLIANRGEIAQRIANACRELAIRSVAIYSEADARAPYVLAADEAVPIGAPPASDSYLSIPKIIEAARAVRADAVHPGYGFLSENADFAAACCDAGLVFVGPHAEVIRTMGSKIEARKLMQQAGVPVVPGETPQDQTQEGIEAAIRGIGFPALIKASAGGGGRGMRHIRTADEIEAAVQSARREAIAAFGNGTLYVERLLQPSRHIEVQVFADAFGNVVHLFERDCSVQRRHQKVIEESPSPCIAPIVRQRITAAAVNAVRTIGYCNAGTIEFLVEGHGETASFYFLEMNTRLQVEHPVTEAVTGTDLVRAQLVVAAGGSLPWKQEDISQRGHAIECRIYAEDPLRGFLPQAGRLLFYEEPRMPGIRVDSGVLTGSEVTVHYDPMLAKLIATAENRESARTRLIAALRAFPILGIHTNIAFLLQILGNDEFIKGNIDTAFLDREGSVLAETAAATRLDAAIAVAAAHRNGFRSSGNFSEQSFKPLDQDPWSVLRGWRN